MSDRKPKTLEDFPKFEVLTVRRGETSATGYTRFELDGQFDRIIDGIDPHWFWLLMREHNSLCATLKSLNKESKAALLTCDEKTEPNVAGQTLFYLSPYWQAQNVWMILDPNWGWKRTQFDGRDAVASDYEAKDISIVDGREVKIWTKLEPADRTDGTSRHFPAADQNQRPNATPRIIAGGWDHQHCDLCKSHIDAIEFGYRDPQEHWLCNRCYERYVVPHDLSFVDEL
ncbi:MAG: hypothetical protein WA867_22290 [Candidatus Acidiferrales bacterium]